MISTSGGVARLHSYSSLKCLLFIGKKQSLRSRVLCLDVSRFSSKYSSKPISLAGSILRHDAYNGGMASTSREWNSTEWNGMARMTCHEKKGKGMGTEQNG